MGERERRGAPPYGGNFVSRAQVMDAGQIRRAVKRMAHEIVERNGGLADLVIVGLQTGGIEPAIHLVEALEAIEGIRLPLGTVDVAFHRDDIGLRPVLPEAPTEIPVELTGQTVILVDDVLFTGRTVRAALDALTDFDHRVAAGTRAAVVGVEERAAGAGAGLGWRGSGKAASQAPGTFLRGVIAVGRCR